jgi:hypothetical protein
MRWMLPWTSSGQIGQWLDAARKRRSVKGYLRRLPKQLFEDYGHRGPYAPGQVEASVQRAKLSAEFCPYAQAIFCDATMLPSGVRHDFRAIRRELGQTYFTDGAGGGGEYTYAEVSRLVGEHGGYGGHFGSEGSGDGGGHHGGDGGHH